VSSNGKHPKSNSIRDSHVIRFHLIIQAAVHLALRMFRSIWLTNQKIEFYKLTNQKMLRSAKWTAAFLIGQETQTQTQSPIANVIRASALRRNHTSHCRLDCDCDWRLLFNQSEQSSHRLINVLSY